MPNTYTVTYVCILSRAAWYDYRPHVACVYLKIGAEGRMGRKQGDQIGRFFLLLGDFFTMINVLRSNFRPTFFPRYQFLKLILTKHRLGYISGDFFTDSSGHPASKTHGLEVVSRVARFSLSKIPKREKIYQITTKYTKWL
jgi:hypothetical protein